MLPEAEKGEVPRLLEFCPPPVPPTGRAQPEATGKGALETWFAGASPSEQGRSGTSAYTTISPCTRLRRPFLDPSHVRGIVPSNPFALRPLILNQAMRKVLFFPAFYQRGH